MDAIYRMKLWFECKKIKYGVIMDEEINYKAGDIMKVEI